MTEQPKSNEDRPNVLLNIGCLLAPLAVLLCAYLLDMLGIVVLMSHYLVLVDIALLILVVGNKTWTRRKKEAMWSAIIGLFLCIMICLFSFYIFSLHAGAVMRSEGVEQPF